jgi:hypothetical protein
MPEYRHPLADADTPGKPPAQIHVGRREDNVAVADDGTFTVPAPVAEAEAARCGVDVEAMRVEPQGAASDTCGALDASTSDDCGRDPGWGRDTDSGPCTDHVAEGDA